MLVLTAVVRVAVCTRITVFMCILCGGSSCVGVGGDGWGHSSGDCDEVGLVWVMLLLVVVVAYLIVS